MTLIALTSNRHPSESWGLVPNRALHRPKAPAFAGATAGVGEEQL